jgi:hypothetical protein
MSTERARTDAATAGHMRRAALRAVDDPATLAKAARIVRAALARRVLTPRDLTGEIVQPSDLVPTFDARSANGGGLDG